MQRHAQLFLVLLLFVSTALAQSGVVVPGENLVVEGVPPIPTALVEDVQRYTKFRVTFLLSWHPARREMLISTCCRRGPVLPWWRRRRCGAVSCAPPCGGPRRRACP